MKKFFLSMISVLLVLLLCVSCSPVVDNGDDTDPAGSDTTAADTNPANPSGTPSNASDARVGLVYGGDYSGRVRTRSGSTSGVGTGCRSAHRSCNSERGVALVSSFGNLRTCGAACGDTLSDRSDRIGCRECRVVGGWRCVARTCFCGGGIRCMVVCGAVFGIPLCRGRLG